LYQAKILEIGAQRAQLIRLLENSMESLLTRSVHLDSESAIPVALSTQQHGISAANGDASEVNTGHISPSQGSWSEARWDSALNEEEETLDWGSPTNYARSPTPTQENWRSHMRQTIPSSFHAAKMSPVVEDVRLEDDDNALPPESRGNGMDHVSAGIGNTFRSADIEGEGLQQAADFDSPEMSGWRIDPSQSNWGTDPQGSSRDDGDEDVRNILSMDVNSALSSNPPWRASPMNFHF